MENEAPLQDPEPDTAPESSPGPAPEPAPAAGAAPAQGYRKQAKKDEKPPAPPKAKKPYTPPKPSITVEKWPVLLEAIAAGKVDTIRELIAQGVNVNTVRDGFSPLMTAAAAGNVDVARVLLEAGANVNEKDDDGNTAFHRAASYQPGSAMIELLLQSGVDVDAKNRFGKTALALAEEQGHREVVRSIQAHFDRRAKDEQDWLAFLETPEGAPYKQKKQWDLLTRYLQFLWAPPVAFAVAGLLLGLLFGAGLLLFFLGLLSGGAASWMAWNKEKQLRALFEAHEPLPDLDIHMVRDKRKAHEPLPRLQKKKPAERAIAAEEAHPVPHAAAVSPSTHQAQTAATLAAAPPAKGEPEPLEAIILPEPVIAEPPAPPADHAIPVVGEADAPMVPPAPEPAPIARPAAPRPAAEPAHHAQTAARPSAKPALAPLSATLPKTRSAASSLLDNLPDKRILMLAAAALLLLALAITAVAYRHELLQRYYAHKVRSLGFEVSGPSLLEAVAGNNAGAIDLFVKAGLPLDAVDDKGKTVLMVAAEKGHRDLLVHLGRSDAALLDRQDLAGNTALMTAARQGRDEIVSALVDLGASTELAAPTGQGAFTALHAAVSAPDFGDAHLRVMRALLDHGAKVNARDANGRTALLLAAAQGREQAVSLLLERGADPAATDQAGEFPLLAASCRGYTAVARRLLDKGADIKQSVKGETSFPCAVEEDHLDTMKLLLERGADVNSQTAGGVTVLTIASGMENAAAVALLLEKGADPATGYIPAPFLSLKGRPVSIRAVNGGIGKIFQKLAQAAEKDGYTITVERLPERKVTLRAKDSWNRVLHKLAMHNGLLLLVKDKEISVLSSERPAQPAAH